MHIAASFTRTILPAVLLALAGCAAAPTIATDVSYCCEATARGVGTFRIEFADTPEFLKPMLRDAAAIALHDRGMEYTEGDAHAILRMTYVDRTIAEAEQRDLDAWERIAPGGGVRFIAEVQLEMVDAVTRERIFAGTMRRIHNVYEGSYMHDAPARAAMVQAFRELFAGLPGGDDPMP